MPAAGLQGRFVHVGPSAPLSTWDMSFELPWWRDHVLYRVGALTARACRVRLCNVLTQQEEVMEVRVPTQHGLVIVSESLPDMCGIVVYM